MINGNKHKVILDNKAYTHDNIRKIYNNYVYYYNIKNAKKIEKNWKRRMLDEMNMKTILTSGIAQDDFRFLFRNLYKYSSDLTEAYLEFMMYLDQQDKYEKCPLSYFYAIVRDHDYVAVKNKDFWKGESNKEYWEHYDPEYVYEHVYVASNGIEIYKVYSKAFQ